MERERFLSRVSRAIAARGPDDPGPSPGLVPAEERRDLVIRFRRNLEALGGTAHEPSAEDVFVTVAEIMRAATDGRFLAWDQPHLPVAGILDEIERLGMVRRSHAVPVDARGRRAHQLGYYDCAVGLTGADAGLAESGSIILSSGRGRPRMASLIPETHIALLPRSRISASLGHWILDRPDALATEANWTIITGPSRTADIEQVLTRGVHGPRDVHVVIV